MPFFAHEPAHLSSETIDGETIIIDLNKGFYFSLENKASEIWELFSKGYSKEVILKGFPNAKEFITELEKEELFHFKEESKESPLLDNVDNAIPALQKFTDMKDLLLLDPIHETSEMGWPHQLAETSSSDA